MLNAALSFSQGLSIIDQDYEQALQTANDEGKLLLVDFYTTWCGPCKLLDKYIFHNDSIQGLLHNQFVVLKYDAEDDKKFHLSKKHHVSSYPTALILNQDGYVVNRKYGFAGSDLPSLSKSFFEFTSESISLHKEKKIQKGYSNRIDLSIYPQFYLDFVNRDSLKVMSSKAFENYWELSHDRLSEGYFSTLIYFATDAPDLVVEQTLNLKNQYIELYGKTDTETLLYYLTSRMFRMAVSKKSQEEFNKAEEFAQKSLGQDWADDMVHSYRKSMLEAKGQWKEVIKINQLAIDNNELSGGAINHFSWNVYKNCEDQEVIEKCIRWMEVVTESDPSFDYLDTLAFLLHKSGDATGAKKVALLAIDAGKKDGRKTSGLQKLLDKP